MARKKEATSPFVPVEKQPYSVPENWRWVKLGSITDVVGGGTPSSSVKEYYDQGSIPWISPADLSDYNDIYISCGRKMITELGLAKSSARMLPANTVCLSSRAPIGYVVIAKNPLCTNQGFKSFLPAKCYLPHYLFWFLKGNKEMLESRASGTTFLELSGSKAAQIEFPLPPLPEQQRIVDRIESLFAKLDEAKEKAQTALDGFETRKAAMLHKAFSGELTQSWREKQGYLIEDWETAALSDVSTINPKKIDTKQLPDDMEVSFFPMPALSEVTGEITAPQTRKLSEVSKGFSNFSEGDVVFAKITPCMENGKSAVIGKLINDIGFGTTEFFVFRCGEKLFNRYLYHIVRSQHFRDEAKSVMAGAVGQQRVPKSFLEQYTIMLPSTPEQTEIVRILDDFFARESRAKEQIEATLAAIDTMKKAILAKAFRGELGTNDPTEAPAELTAL